MDTTLYSLDTGLALADLVSDEPAPPADEIEPQREAA